ncbi:hypothetical protein C8046_11795 [Serinibacter arcticus]|uniref:HhH-GPD domain-containing protein n=1 Tax=Serinibacter arcticus TaxID=1655435 RepID=A0A2U1ZW90_9MICO|nr:hypothetical protein [Serinibacter arcticus]PWD51234.1 hypothetical protein C8046_11795 [Serinibacter arcticus]
MPHDPRVATLVEHIRSTIGTTPKEWPGGWTGEIESALIDAVFSIRARYGNRSEGRETGVFGAVTRWRKHREGAANDLTVLAATSVGDLAELTNNAKASGRLKAEIVIEAAKALVDAGIVTAEDFEANIDAAGKAYRSVRGCGPVTWRYLRMLLGHPGVKPDVWILRFLDDAGVTPKDKNDAVDLLTAASEELDLDVKRVDHAIWSYQRS